MKHVFQIFFLLAGLLWLLALGCSTSLEPNSDGTYRVRIPVSDEQGQYHLETVTLKSITNISSLESSTVNIRLNGTIAAEEMADGNEQMWVKNFGTVPSAHFIESGGVLIPSDFRTAIMASMIYQFETIRDFYDGFNANVGLRFPRMVLLDVKKIKSTPVGVSIEHNDAEYVGLDLFEIQPYNGKFLPLSINGGILAHEYFHSIFDLHRRKMGEGKARTKIENEMSPELQGLLCENYFQFKGFNEGIADFFGYAYSHNSDFGSKSFESNPGRDLKVFKTLDGEGGPCTLNEHELAKPIAHLLYTISEDWGVTETAKAILNFLDFYMDLYTTDYDKTFIGIKRILPLLFGNHRPSDDLCKKMKKIVTTPNAFSGYCKEAQSISLVKINAVGDF